jgi:cytochrome P450
LKQSRIATQLRKPIADRSPYPSIARAYAKSWLSWKRLPPGDLVSLDDLERNNRTILMERSAVFGPIFKGLMENRLVVCIVDDTMGRRLLLENAKSLRQVAIQIDQLFPHGHMRQMEGETHREYRKMLGRGIAAIDFASLAPALENLVATRLDALSARQTSADLTEVLTDIANHLLLLLFFGTRPAETLCSELLAGYHRLGPNGVVWNITEKQVEAFQDLRTLLLSAMGGNQVSEPACLLARLMSLGQLDETLLGNMIYMVELARYDLRGLLRWVLKYAADHPAWIDQIEREPADAAARRGSLAEAFVLEVLRLEQSERLMRDVKEDIVFDGYLIPKNSLVRICMWENHKSEAKFSNAFAFDPKRFLDNVAIGDRFLPFGLDHHHCPFSSLSIKLAMVFLRTLARSHKVTAFGGEPPVRGPYHWQPSPGFKVALHPREKSPT